MIKKLFEKYREIIVYIGVGLLTTLVAYGVRFAVLYPFAALLSIDLGVNNAEATVLRTAAITVGWVAGVIFAFFTNKKYVFGDTNTQTRHMWRKLAEFSASRVLTLVLDTVLTFGIVALLGALSYEAILLPLVKIPLSADLIAKCVAAVFVIVGNFILSKLFVFRKSQE